MINKVKEVFYLSALYLLIFLTCVIGITGLLFLFKYSISYLQLILSFIISIIYFMLFVGKKYKINNKILSIILSIIIVIFSSYISSKYFDISWDGNTYHKDAVGALKNGWNPIYQDYIDFYSATGNRDMNLIGNEIYLTHGFWQTYYAKGAWYVNANFYYLFDDIEAAKVFNILLVYITFVFSAYFLNRFIKKNGLLLVIAFLFAISPVVIVQLFTNYNDGVLYNCLLCLILSFILFMFSKRKDDMLTWVFCLIIIISNIKFTGFVYAGFFCLSLYIVYFYNNRQDLKKIIKPTIVFASSVIVAIFIAGFSPYVTNTINKGNPFYPLLGNDKVDIITYNQPKEFANASTIEKFLRSIFSETANIKENSKNETEFKIPFFVYNNELSELNKVDLRIGGFGVYFSGIFIISICSIIYGLYISYTKNINIFVCCSAILITTVLLVLILGESWWARYTPFVYFIPLIAIFMLVTVLKGQKFTKTFLTLLILIMFLNISFFVNNNFLYNYNESKNFRQILEKYSENEALITIVDPYNTFLGTIYNFDDYDINYNISLEKSSDDKQLFRYLNYR